MITRLRRARSRLRTPGRLSIGLASLSVAAVSAVLLPVSPAVSAPDPSCPAAKPVAHLAAGDPVTGLTVSSGTTPDSFGGKFVGVLPNGIAPGLDLLIVKLEGSVITDPVTGEVDRGIWAGMSGSPVYASDGKLIGAVSYGLSWSPSNYAGVTPAADMYAIQDYLPANARPARRVELNKSLTRSLLADSDMTAKDAAEGLRRLPMPLTASGLSTQKARDIARTGGLNPRRIRGGGASAAGAVEPVEITPGGNLVASLAYGDISLTGTGTATAVCGNAVIGFGHPMLFDGKSDLTMHGGTALYIQRDNVFGSFKVATPATPTGAIRQDRLAGILGVDGRLPKTAVVTTDLSGPAGRHRTGSTSISSDDYLGYAVALHTFYNLLRVLDAYTPGSAALTWTIGLTDSDGRSLSMTRLDKFASSWSAAEEPVYSLWDDVEKIQNNNFENVQINTIDVEGSITDKLRELTIRSVERRAGQKWVQIPKRGGIQAKAGSTVQLRVNLKPTRDSQVRPQALRLDLRVPRKEAGSFGEVTVAGNGFDPNRRSHVGSLKELLNKLSSAPGNDTVTAFAQFRRPRAEVADQGVARAVVDGYFNFGLRVKR